MATYHVAHDSFARGGYHRESVAGAPECRWCGRMAPVLFIYQWESDDRCRGIRIPIHTFCNLSCFRAYCGA